ncbi:hypothetical protein QUA30_00680 [Microcoleus sp. Pol14C2]|uniref:hypothetical protein n=1 Tax=unclassified Microcoleus TaxID=2642155 RepID=UPI002FCFE8BE
MDGVVEVMGGKIRSHFPIIHQKSRRDRTSVDKSLSRMMRSPLLPSKTTKCTGKSLHRPRLSS